MLRYPVTLTTDTETNTVLADFPDVPWCHSAGYDESEALLNAEDALTSALGVFIERRQAIPEPSEIKSNEAHITLTALTTAKILLWNEIIRQGVRKSDLARQLNCHMPQIDRLLDFEHSSKIELVETALKLLGKQLSVQLAA